MDGDRGPWIGAWAVVTGVAATVAAGFLVARSESDAPLAPIWIAGIVMLVGLYFVFSPLFSWWPWRRPRQTSPPPASTSPVTWADLQLEGEVDERIGLGFTFRLRIHNSASRRALLRAEVVAADGGPRSLGSAPPWPLAGDDLPALRIAPDTDATIDFASTEWFFRRPSDGEIVWSGNPTGDPARVSVSIALGLKQWSGGVLDYVGNPIHVTVKLWIDETDEVVGSTRFQIDFEEVPTSAAVTAHLRPTMFIAALKPGPAPNDDSADLNLSFGQIKGMAHSDAPDFVPADRMIHVQAVRITNLSRSSGVSLRFVMRVRLPDGTETPCEAEWLRRLVDGTIGLWEDHPPDAPRPGWIDRIPRWISRVVVEPVDIPPQQSRTIELGFIYQYADLGALGQHDEEGNPAPVDPPPSIFLDAIDLVSGQSTTVTIFDPVEG